MRVRLGHRKKTMHQYSCFNEICGALQGVFSLNIWSEVRSGSHPRPPLHFRHSPLHPPHRSYSTRHGTPIGPGTASHHRPPPCRRNKGRQIVMYCERVCLLPFCHEPRLPTSSTRFACFRLPLPNENSSYSASCSCKTPLGEVDEMLVHFLCLDLLNGTSDIGHGGTSGLQHVNVSCCANMFSC